MRAHLCWTTSPLREHRLTETNRILEHVDQILQRIPEVSITSRRTGLQMGLAAVTEANTGDFTVRLKTDRSRAIDEMIADAREQIHAAEPSLDMEFTQVLQDMIGDLSNSPEPIQIKLFSNDQNLLLTLGPRVQQAIAKIPGVVDTQNGVDNTISGPATNFQIDPWLPGGSALRRLKLRRTLRPSSMACPPTIR